MADIYMNPRLLRPGYGASKFKGVSRYGTGGRWMAQCIHHYITYKLGVFDTPEEAARAYDAKARELHGPMTFQNFPLTAAEGD